MKAIIKLESVKRAPKEGEIVICKQFQESYRAYRVKKNWDNFHFDLAAVTSHEFHSYDEIHSVPIELIYQVVCEAYGVTYSLRKDYDYEYAVKRIGEEVEVMEREEYDKGLESPPYTVISYATLIHQQ